eukprot:TRINITY_DN68548_c0_g1_i1.p1 TRINITY_DN68548_c0_g1~~TRINITY_DN68548_c0_g1_i1.p1  ORF type:complete len:126 (+),score=18.33 TRINITY_DN68548_c0_g1_i1:49-426(+)
MMPAATRSVPLKVGRFTVVVELPQGIGRHGIAVTSSVLERLAMEAEKQHPSRAASAERGSAKTQPSEAKIKSDLCSSRQQRTEYFRRHTSQLSPFSPGNLPSMCADTSLNRDACEGNLFPLPVSH